MVWEDEHVLNCVLAVIWQTWTDLITRIDITNKCSFRITLHNVCLVFIERPKRLYTYALPWAMCNKNVFIIHFNVIWYQKNPDSQLFPRVILRENIKRKLCLPSPQIACTWRFVCLSTTQTYSWYWFRKCKNADNEKNTQGCTLIGTDLAVKKRYTM